MITLLENVLERSDGSYISSQDLAALDRSIASWQERRETYDLVQTQENAIIDQVLTVLQEKMPAFSQQDSEEVLTKCRRDLTLVLRYSAISMLFQDEELLKDRLLYWMQNIMRALRRQKVNDRIYQLLQQIVQQSLPEDKADQMLPYLKIAHEWLSQ